MNEIMNNPFLKVANHKPSIEPNENNSTFFTTPKKCKKTL